MKLSQEDIAYLRQKAAQDGYNPDHALQVFNYESSNRPEIWGGKGGKYFGLFQAGPSERAQFGVDTEHPSAQNQIDAFGKFLAGRGFKPGMGLQDMYSTVLAGSPGHANRSDGFGTVAQHVARMGGAPAPAAPAAGQNGLLAPSAPDSKSLAALAYADLDKPPEALPGASDAGLPQPAQPQPNPIAGLLTQVAEQQKQQQEEEKAKRDAALQQLLALHNAQHGAAVQGLLGG
jgi:hypothetical protein